MTTTRDDLLVTRVLAPCIAEERVQGYLAHKVQGYLAHKVRGYFLIQYKGTSLIEYRGTSLTLSPQNEQESFCATGETVASEHRSTMPPSLTHATAADGSQEPRPYCFRATGEQYRSFSGLSPESQGKNLAWSVLHVPSLLDSGRVRATSSGCDNRLRAPLAWQRGACSAGTSG